MVKFCNDFASKKSSTSDIEIFSQVLGPRSGYLRGLERCVKPSTSSSGSKRKLSNSSQELKEIRLEIEQLKSRLRKFEELISLKVPLRRQQQEELQMRLEVRGLEMLEHMQMIMSQKFISPPS